MNDAMKGISILSLTAVAISWVLHQDNEGFDLAFLTHDSAERSAVLQLQESILAGNDPTLSQEPSAAGEGGFNCYRGQLSIDDEQQSYLSVANHTRMFVRVVGQQLILEVPIADKTMARKAESVPVDVAVALADLQSLKEQCVHKDLIIGALK